MPDLEVLELHRLLRTALVGAVAVVVAQIVVVAGDRFEHVVPHDLGRDLGIVGIDQRERLTGHIAHHGPMILAEPNLRGIFLGRILTARRPIDALGGTIFNFIPCATL